jgi:glucose/arabinose dehydrogenase
MPGMRAHLLGPVAAALAALTTSLLPAVPPGASAAAAPPATTAYSTLAGPARARPAGLPALRVRRLVTGLDHPWDVRPAGPGRLLFTQRDRATLTLWDHGRRHRVRGFPSRSVWVSGETGLLGLETATGFLRTHVVYTCQGATTASGHDVRVLSWTLGPGLRRVVAHRTLLAGLPATSGRHGGCRLLAVADRLYVGTGDAATGTNPESLHSLGGKTLCLLPATGRPCPTNRWAHARNRHQRYVHTYGHRNVQGLDVRSDGTLWSVEQGTYRDDEVNRLRNGGDYGYNPVPGYNESVPMTDPSLPGRQWAAVWRSGDPTLATSGGGFVHGRAWRWYDGTLAVAALKAERVLFLKLTRAGTLRRVVAPAALRRFGRLRTVVDGRGSVLYVPTDNGGGHDAILAVRPVRR